MSESAHELTGKTFLVVLMALFALTALTVWAAFQDFGGFNNVVALGIAGIKTWLVIYFFMHVKYATNFTKLAILSGVIFLLILFAFVIADVDTRGVMGVPGK